MILLRNMIVLLCIYLVLPYSTKKKIFFLFILSPSPLFQVTVDRLKEVRDFATAHSTVLINEMTNMEKEEAEIDYPLKNQRFIPLKGRPLSGMGPSASSTITPPPTSPTPSSPPTNFSSSAPSCSKSAISPSPPPPSSSSSPSNPSPSFSTRPHSKSLPSLSSDSKPITINNKSSPPSSPSPPPPCTSPSDSISKRLSSFVSPGGSVGRRKKREKRAMTPKTKNLDWRREGKREEEDMKKDLEVEEEYVMVRRNTSGALFGDSVVEGERGEVGERFCSGKLLERFKEELEVGCYG